ncbi:MAG TPA: hypothetical protein VLN57_21240 [Xanthobacteraceae bacterium]|nr:hypothetical protein [Xanthobacteraceae bacterium]
MPIVTGYIGPIHCKDLRLGPPAVRIDPRDWRVQRLAPEALVRFVLDVVERRIFLGQEIAPAGDLYCVFPGLAMLTEITADARREIGTFYEYRDRAIGQTLHGNPSLPSVQFLHYEDWEQARDMIAAEVLRRERA